MSKEQVYVSVDCEFDGPIPGIHSMLEIGIVVMNHALEDIWESHSYLSPLPEACKDPDTHKWLVANGVYDNWIKNKKDIEPNLINPRSVFTRLNTQLATYGIGNCILVGYPSAVEFMWLRFYFDKYCGKSWPFGYSAIDLETLAMPFLGDNPREFSDEILHNKWPVDLSNQHDALADAKRQASWFKQIMNQYSKEFWGIRAVTERCMSQCNNGE